MPSPVGSIPTPSAFVGVFLKTVRKGFLTAQIPSLSLNMILNWLCRTSICAESCKVRLSGILPQDAKENLSGFRIEASGMTLEIGGASAAATKTANQSARNCSNTVALSRFTPKYHSKSNFLSCGRSQFRLRLNQDLPQLLI